MFGATLCAPSQAGVTLEGLDGKCSMEEFHFLSRRVEPGGATLGQE